jgi:molybdate transport system substrate-binding protein
MVLPANSTLSLGQASDLAHPEFKRVGLAGENVPAGKYARAALQALQVWPSVQDRVINGDNVRTVLGWVATGEVDAGAVYATDAKVEARVRVAFSFPPSSYPPIVYPAAIVKSSQQRSDAAQFLNYCASEAGMAVFLSAGFTAAPSSASQ